MQHGSDMKKGPKLQGGNYKGSARNKKTRNPGYQAGDNWLICDVCGCAVYASDAMQRWDGMVTCKQDWEPRHEQDFVRARKDRIAAQGLLRPEGEDDYTTIPGISGPDPFPPEPDFLYFIHDFSRKKMGPFSITSNGPSTVLTSDAERLGVGPNVPSLTGYAWNGSGKYTDVDVGIGVESDSTNDCTIVAYSSDAFQGGSQFSIECCGMIVFYLDADIVGGQYRRVFSFDSQSKDYLSAVTVFTGTQDHSLVFAARTDNTSGGAGNGWFHAQLNDLAFRAGDKVDCRFKFSFTTGLEMWFPDLDRKIHDPEEIPPNIPTENLDRIGISNTTGGAYDMDMTACYILLAATETCTEEEILGWPTWDEPLPIIDKQPASQSVAVNVDAVFTTIVRHPYPTYQWTMDDAPVGTNADKLTIAVDTPGTYAIQCTISNRGGDSVTTDVVTLEVVATEYFHDFSRNYMMPEGNYTRDFPDSTVDYEGNEVTVGANIPTLAGYRWDSEQGEWFDEGVGQGLHLKSDGTVYWADIAELFPLPSEGLVNDFCLQVTGTWLDTQVPATGQTFQIGVLYSWPNYEAILSLQTGKDREGSDITFVSMNFYLEDPDQQDRSVHIPVTITAGQVFDFRVRKRSVEPDGLGSGVTAWLYLHDEGGTTSYGPLQGGDSGTPADCSMDFGPPLNTLDWAIMNSSETELADRYIAQVRIYPGVLTDAEIEAWPTWTPPS